jgi:UDP-N-acetylmuramate dehydrogenase
MIIENNSLVNNSLGIRSKCKYLLTLEDENDFDELKYFLINNNEKFYIVGEGTNLVLPDYYDGIIIRAKFNTLTEDKVNNILKVGAAYNWTDLVNFCISKNINGFENLIDIPGSVGASPVQNIGAYGVEVASLIESIDCYCLNEYKKINLTNLECNFIYRNSSLKNSNRLIYNINFFANKKTNLSINYQTIKDFIRKNNIDIKTTAEVASVISQIRSKALPDPNIINNVGSFFKNPIVDINSINFSNYSKDDLIIWNYDEAKVKVGAARLIELIKNKISIHKNVSLFENHSLVLITNGQATQEDVITYASEIKDLVYETFNIKLEIEPNIIF